MLTGSFSPAPPACVSGRCLAKTAPSPSELHHHHHHRSEHWIVVSGMPETNGAPDIFANTNESTYIAAGHPNRLANPEIL